MTPSAFSGIAEMAFVPCAQPVLQDSCCEMSTKAVHPEPHDIPVDGDGTLRETIFNICRAQTA
jgi:hypothetical protein